MLDVREIDAFFGKVQVISKVSLHIQQREIVSIVGANGAGKTTLLNVIAGLHSSRTGSVAFFKRDISRFTPERIVAEGIILVPEREKVFAPLTVLENLELGAYLRSWRKERKELKRDLDMVYQLFPVLRERKQQLAGTLSGGERQMLALGKAMMGRPRLMMIDEPSLGLAPLVVSEIFRTINFLNHEGMTFLLVEQNVKGALRISNRAYVMETGRIVRTGNGTELLEDEGLRKSFLGDGSLENGKDEKEILPINMVGLEYIKGIV